MAHVQDLFDQDGKLRAHKARWRDPSGNWRSKTFPKGKKREAATYARDQEVAKDKGTYVDMSNKATVTEYVTRWDGMQTSRSGTARLHRGFIKNHLAGTDLGTMRLVRVRHSDVQAWTKDRSRLLGPRALKNLVSFVSSAFNSAVRDGAIASNPAKGVKLPKIEEREIDPLTIAQVRDLIEATPEHYRAAVIAQAGLGPRAGELLGLRVQDVNFLKREVKITEQLSDGRDGTPPHRAPLKNSDKPWAKRTVPLPKVVADALAEHIAKYPPLVDGTEHDGTIFYSKKQHAPLWQGYYHRIFKRAVIDAGLPEDTTPHDLRHHYVSVLLDAGLSVVEVAKRIGDTPEMVLRTYGHVMPDSEDRTRKAIDKAWQAA